ncbi:MAG: NUDIX domain-containing protein [Hyphomicrobium sp.]
MRHYACAILSTGTTILLGLRSPHRRMLANKWDVIGGKVEEGETLEAALKRELNEEIGVTPDVYRSVDSVEDPHEIDKGGATYHMFLVTRWSGGEPELKDDEHVELKWFTPEEAASLENLALEAYRPLFLQLFIGRDEAKSD